LVFLEDEDAASEDLEKEAGDSGEVESPMEDHSDETAEVGVPTTVNHVTSAVKLDLVLVKIDEVEVEEVEEDLIEEIDVEGVGVIESFVAAEDNQFKHTVIVLHQEIKGASTNMLFTQLLC